MTSPADLKVDPFGYLVGHTWAEVGMIINWINQYKVGRFVEIGVHVGGLAAILAHTTEHVSQFYYLGIERGEKIVHPNVRKLIETLPHARLWIANAHSPETIMRTREWIADYKGFTTLIYCDGGDKPKEFALYAPLVGEGSLIAAHDYDYGGYERAEIDAADVHPVARQHGLERIVVPAPYRQVLYWRPRK